VTSITKKIFFLPMKNSVQYEGHHKRGGIIWISNENKIVDRQEVLNRCERQRQVLRCMTEAYRPRHDK
jgi:hypothetical protein